MNAGNHGLEPNCDLVGGRVVDPSLGLDAIRTVVIRRGKIAALLDRAPAETDAACERVDCAGMVLCPGFIDPHVHLREPGDPHKETLASGLAAAAAGGFTAVAAMPNTRPALDTPERLTAFVRDARAAGGVRCYAIGAVTRGREGCELAPLLGMASAGAVAFSDDGATTTSLRALYNAARYAAAIPQAFLSHCHDPSFDDAVMHEGEVSDRLGLPGAPALAEAAVAARDVLVARATGKRWHVCHVSTAMTVDVVRWARSIGVDVSAEVTPHHLLCTDEALEGFATGMRVNPPLRPAADRDALRRAVVEGTITVFASDHAPHAREEKEGLLSCACPGFSGLETAVGATFQALPDVPLAVMVTNFSAHPARLLGVPGGSLAPGAPADVTGLFLNRPWVVDPSLFRSRGKVTPFSGMTFTVKPALTVVGGHVLMHAGTAQPRRAGETVGDSL
jgi:dihydroorotase